MLERVLPLPHLETRIGGRGHDRMGGFGHGAVVAMLAFAADNFPDLFKDYALSVRESHQQGKADPDQHAAQYVGVESGGI